MLPAKIYDDDDAVSLDFKDALTTWVESSPDHMPEICELFRKYQFNIKFFWWWCGRQTEEGRHNKVPGSIAIMKGINKILDEKNTKLGKRVKRIDELINDIADTIIGHTSISNRTRTRQVPIEWKEQPTNADLPSRIQSVTLAKCIPHLTIVSQKRQGARRYGLYSKFKYALLKLEKCLEEITKVHIGMSDPVATDDLVGWHINSYEYIANDYRQKARYLDGSKEVEVAIGKHRRYPVPKEDLGPGGMRRGITRLTLYYRTPLGTVVESIGTGWLADEDTVVTTGHSVFNQELGMLLAVDIFVDYDDEMTRRKRIGTHVAVHREWYTSFVDAYDLACIRLNNSFSEPRSMSLRNSSRQEKRPVAVTVAGYSKELEGGERMHYAKCELSLSVIKAFSLIGHELDTGRGNSGSPVCDEYGNVIGVHRGGEYGSIYSEGAMNYWITIDETVLEDFRTALAMLTSRAETTRKSFVWRCFARPEQHPNQGDPYAVGWS